MGQVVRLPSQSTHLDVVERLAQTSAEALDNVEALAVLIGKAYKGRDPQSLAADLLGRFGSLGAVLAASRSALEAYVSPVVAAELALLHNVIQRVNVEPLRKRDVISSWSALTAYVKAALQHEPREQFRVLYLDKKNCLIADELHGQGTVDHAPVYPREVMRRALELNACSMILVHNHPSGDPSPSSADISMTRQIVDAAKSLALTVHDHVIVGRDDVLSLKCKGLM